MAAVGDRLMIIHESQSESYSLNRVTGGAKGRGEHIRSLKRDEKYTPKARTCMILVYEVS
jgi:hypothetical protein